MKTSKWTGKYHVLSTAHITEEDDKALHYVVNMHGVISLFSMSVYAKEGGWIIMFTDGLKDPSDIRRKMDQDCARFGLNGPVWQRLITYAAGNRCSMLILDRDAEMLDGMDIFEW